MAGGEGTTTEVVRGEVGGIPAFFGPVPPGSRDAAAAAIIFRVGRADEPLPRFGLTHLVEHLAMFAVGELDYSANALVDDTRTLFYASGEPHEVVDFMRRVCGALRSLPLDRLELEKRVLETESMTAPDLLARLLSARFGVRGFGISKYRELGLRTATPESVTEWAQQRFTRGNATLWAAGDLQELEIELPDGSRYPAPEPRPLPALELPAAVSEGEGGVAAGYLVERSFETTLGLGLLAERLHRRLRTERAVSYGVDSSYYPMTGKLAHCTLVADCLDEHAADVAREMLDGLTALAGAGPTEEEVERAKRLSGEAISDPGAVIRRLDVMATDELLGVEPDTVAQLLDDLERTDAAGIAARAAEARDSLLMMVPTGVEAPSGLGPWKGLHHARVVGERYTWGRRGKRNGEVIIGPAGITLLPREGDMLTVRFDECAAVTTTVRGALTFAGTDETTIRLVPAELRGPEDALATIKAALPEWMFVPADEGRAGEVEEVASAKLSRRLFVENELAALPELLLPGEQVVNLAEATRNWKVGLLALTDRRLLFLYRGGIGKDVTVEIPRGDAHGVRATGIMSKTLHVGTRRVGGEKFESIAPRERAQELSDSLGGS